MTQQEINKQILDILGTTNHRIDNLIYENDLNEHDTSIATSVNMDLNKLRLALEKISKNPLRD